ncbi:MAG TPA: non-canonical purine NTP pyrophosphatase [Opitutaceae bacterium]|nr:non-canonical purine NTP pyrophosphatase [Opitutaceae bacterium]
MRLHLASANPGKLREHLSLARALLERRGLPPIELVSAAAVGGMPAVPEDTGTFEGNVRQKAEALRARLPAEAWVLADDSGLCVDALGGAPGVDSAVYAGPEGDSAANLAKLVREMRPVPGGLRAAHFVCLLLLLGPGGVDRSFTGRCEGRLLLEPSGAGGFGYDPLFVPAGASASFGELPEAEKNELSHRARAWAKLADWLSARR